MKTIIKHYTTFLNSSEAIWVQETSTRMPYLYQVWWFTEIVVWWKLTDTSTDDSSYKSRLFSSVNEYYDMVHSCLHYFWEDRYVLLFLKSDRFDHLSYLNVRKLSERSRRYYLTLKIVFIIELLSQSLKFLSCSLQN